MIKPVLYRISYLASSFANYELAFPPSRGAEFLLVFASYKFTKMYEIYPPTSLISFILNTHWHELWKQEKCPSLTPPSGIFYKT